MGKGGAERTARGQVIVDLLKQYPNEYSRAIARMAFEQEPELFSSVEQARTVVRYYRDANGDHARKCRSDESRVELENVQEFNPLGLPSSDEDEFEWLPYRLSEGCKRMLCLYDVHVPYHDVRACNVALQYGLDHDADSIFIGGDFMDCYGLSRYEKDPRNRSFKEELELTRLFLEKIRELFPKARIYYQLGNHEERYQSLLRSKAPQFIGIESFMIDVLLNFRDLSIELIDQKRVAKFGKLNLIHGHELPGGAYSPVNPAKGLYNKAKRSTMCGHHHQTSEHTEKDINDEMTTCWSVGTLGTLHPEYAVINKWNHGFAFVVREGDEFHVTNKRIYNGRLM